jgi:hypothetical protein
MNLLKAAVLFAILLPLQAWLTTVQRWILMNIFGFVPSFVLGGLILMALIMLLAWIGWGFSAPQPARTYWLLGALWGTAWVGLQVWNVLYRATAAWSDVAHYYTFWSGNLGAPVLLTLVAAPRLAGISAARNRAARYRQQDATPASSTHPTAGRTGKRVGSYRRDRPSRAKASS